MASQVTEADIAKAVQHHWVSRATDDEDKDVAPSQEGRRNEILEDSHMSEFGAILYEKLLETGLPKGAIGSDSDLTDRSPKLPGFFRPSKDWDIVVVQDSQLVAAVEFKSQASSFGNNWNNRVEEAIGNAYDVRMSVDKGVIGSPVTPWLGYFFLMGDQARFEGMNSVPPAMRLWEAFRDLSYADRCEKLCMRLIEVGLYDGSAFMLSPREGGLDGEFQSPNPELTFQRFAASLIEHVVDFLDCHGERQSGLDTF